MKVLARLLILVAVVLGGFAIWRGFFYYPNDEVDSGLVAGTPNLPDAGAEQISLPDHLLIPRLNIDADVQHLGITKKGNMAAPSNFTDVAWYKYGTVPGNVGSAVMAGHEDNAAGLDGVFKHLDDLALGDDVYVVDADGEKLHFRVTDKKVYPYNLSGTELNKVFNAKDKAHLNLITCTGEWVQALKTNDKRLVVFTELVK